MKNYISVAALLIAGTAFANADVVVFNGSVDGATEQTVADGAAGDAAINVSNILGDASLTITRTNGVGKYWLPGSNIATIVNGNALNALAAATGLEASALQNIGGNKTGFNNGNANSKQQFAFTGLDASTDYTFSAVFYSNGEAQAVLDVTEGTFVSGNYGALTDGGSWNELAENSSQIFAGTTTFDPVAVTFTATTDASGNLTFTVDHKPGIALIGVTPAAAPEPSAFGLLAGLGALALVASRRRRK